MTKATFTSKKAALTAVANAAMDACPQEQWGKLASNFNANNFVNKVGKDWVCDLEEVTRLVKEAHPSKK